MTVNPDEILSPYRAKIDSLDQEIVDLLLARAQIINDVAHLKFQHKIPAVLQNRVDEVRENAAKDAAQKGGDADYIREIYRTIIQLSCDMEESIFKEKEKNSK